MNRCIATRIKGFGMINRNILYMTNMIDKLLLVGSGIWMALGDMYYYKN